MKLSAVVPERTPCLVRDADLKVDDGIQVWNGNCLPANFANPVQQLQLLMKSDKTTERTMMIEKTARMIWLALALVVFLPCFLLLDMYLSTFLMFLECLSYHILQFFYRDRFGQIAIGADL